ncbi:hypothetical protein ACFV9G_22990 [Nocardioides sp. NPDC059952]|uniref:hypothetical protein n=1 Tax=Nocardioides sp. NPDC059952 TaxID=3347014 RepID=UPI003667AE76
MSDLIYILLTLACFTGLALLVGLIDRRLGATDPDADPDADSDTDPDVGTAAEAAGASVPHDSQISGAAR